MYHYVLCDTFTQVRDLYTSSMSVWPLTLTVLFNVCVFVLLLLAAAGGCGSCIYTVYTAAAQQ
jgi:hypothetical protein